MSPTSVDSGEDGVFLSYTSPAPELAPYISPVYDFRSSRASYADYERANFAQLRFLVHGAASRYRFADGHSAVSPQIDLVGPTSGPTEFYIEGPFTVVGCGLMAHGWAAICDLDAAEVTDRVLDARDYIDFPLDAVRQALAEAETVEARAAIMFDLVRRLLRRVPTSVRTFTCLVNDWLADSESPEVEQLIQASGLSRRQVERQCRRYYGLPPKFLARKYRALKASVALTKREASPIDLCAESFYDQSHLTREVKQFAGSTPRRLRDQASTLTKLTMIRTQASNTLPIVSKS